ncbi:unnamed protein product, partial [Acidithrix sp. C25]
VGVIVSAHPILKDATVAGSFWSKLISNFGLFVITIFNQHFTNVAHTQLAPIPFS